MRVSNFFCLTVHLPTDESWRYVEIASRHNPRLTYAPLRFPPHNIQPALVCYSACSKVARTREGGKRPRCLVLGHLRRTQRMTNRTVRQGQDRCRWVWRRRCLRKLVVGHPGEGWNLLDDRPAVLCRPVLDILDQGNLVGNAKVPDFQPD